MLDLQTKLATENDCFNYLMQIRWNGKPQCVYCNHNKVCTVKDGDFKCSKCNKRFTIKTNTIFQGSKLSLQKWLMAIYFVTNDKKGVSSIQLADNIGVTQKTAWSMLQKLKYLLVNVEKSKGELNGTTEIDEAYIGGKEGNMHKNKKVNAEKENLLPKINIHNARGSMIVTDTLQAYNDLKGNYNHKTVKHSAGEYVRVEKDGFKTHTNSIEGFWSLVKRTINGTHHWVSKKHINKYLAEMSFRYSNKSLSVAERFEAICLSSNLNITYKQIIA